MKTSFFEPKKYSYLWYDFTWKGNGIVLVWILLSVFIFLNIQEEGFTALSFLGVFLITLLILFNWYKRYQNKIWPFGPWKGWW